MWISWALDKIPGRTAVIQYPLSLTLLPFEPLLHKQLQRNGEGWYAADVTDFAFTSKRVAGRLLSTMDSFFRSVNMSWKVSIFSLLNCMFSVVFCARGLGRWTVDVVHIFSFGRRNDSTLAASYFTAWCHWTMPAIPTCQWKNVRFCVSVCYMLYLLVILQNGVDLGTSICCWVYWEFCIWSTFAVVHSGRPRVSWGV